jgi:hypothetical protein
MHVTPEIAISPTTLRYLKVADDLECTRRSAGGRKRASEVPRLHHARRGPRRFCSVRIVAAKIKRSSKFWDNFDFSEGEKKDIQIHK